MGYSAGIAAAAFALTAFLAAPAAAQCVTVDGINADNFATDFTPMHLTRTIGRLDTLSVDGDDTRDGSHHVKLAFVFKMSSSIKRRFCRNFCIVT